MKRYRLIAWLNNFLEKKDRETLSKCHPYFAVIIPDNPVELRLIYDDHSTKFIEASYKENISEEQVAMIDDKLHVAGILHAKDNVIQGDWENYIFRNISDDVARNLQGRNKKAIDNKKVIFYIGTSKNALGHFYNNLQTFIA